MSPTPDTRPTIGWKPLTVPGDCPKVPCSCCSRRVRSGVAHFRANPRDLAALLCHTCYRIIREENRDPKGGDN